MRLLGQLLTGIFFMSLSLNSSANSIENLIDSLSKTGNSEAVFQNTLKKTHDFNNVNLPYRLNLSKFLVAKAIELKSNKHIGRAYYELGYSYEIIGEPEKALTSCFKALEYLELANDQNYISKTYNELGLIYSYFKDEPHLKKSMEYFRKFLTIQQKLDIKKEIAGAYSNIAYVFIRLKQYDSTLYYARKSLAIRLEINETKTIPISYTNIAEAMMKTGHADSSLFYQGKAIDFFKKANNFYGLNNAYTTLFFHYLDLNDLKTTKYYLDKKLDLAKKIDGKHEWMYYYYDAYEYFKASNNDTEALNFYEKYINIRDSINGIKTKEQINNLQAVYEFEKIEKENELLLQKQTLHEKETKLKSQRINFLIVFAILLITIFTLVVLYLIKRRKQEKRILEVELISRQKDKELAESELEKSKLKEKELNVQLEYKSKQLTTHALNMMKKNQFLQEVEDDISSISKKSSDDVKDNLRSLNQSIKRMNKTEKDWELFKNYFEEVNIGFYENLSKNIPGLTNNDYRVCALIKLNMNIKESATVLNISPESVKTARYRLRKKLGLNQEDDLHEYIMGI